MKNNEKEMKNKPSNNGFSRRDFITKTAYLAGGLALGSSIFSSCKTSNQSQNKYIKIYGK
jgi:hypothetical protein